MLFGLLYPDPLCRGMNPDPIPDANLEPVISLADLGGIENWP